MVEHSSRRRSLTERFSIFLGEAKAVSLTRVGRPEPKALANRNNLSGETLVPPPQPQDPLKSKDTDLQFEKSQYEARRKNGRERPDESIRNAESPSLAHESLLQREIISIRESLQSEKVPRWAAKIVAPIQARLKFGMTEEAASREIRKRDQEVEKEISALKSEVNTISRIQRKAEALPDLKNGVKKQAQLDLTGSKATDTTINLSFQKYTNDTGSLKSRMQKVPPDRGLKERTRSGRAD